MDKSYLMVTQPPLVLSPTRIFFDSCLFNNYGYNFNKKEF